MRKNNLLSLGCAGFAAASAVASPLNLENVAKDSKWLLHLDMDALRKTKIGAHFIEKILQPKIDDAEEVKKMNLSVNLQNISSVTAYGPAFEKNGDGVLLIRTTADVKKDLDTLSGLSSLSGGDALKLSQLKPFPVYSFKSNVFIAPNIEGAVVIAKSKEQIESARQILLGKSDTLATITTFSDYPSLKKTFFFLGMAEGFNENAAIPPQAQVLKETRGGRLVLGESEDKVFANLVFKGKDDESSTKIQQVFQGIIALVSLSQENQDLTDLAKAANISSEGRNVMINVQFPVGKAMHHLDEEVGE